MDNSRTIRGMIQEIVIQETRYLKHYVGQIVDITDDTNKGRVKVTVPMLGWISPDQGAWCFPRDKHSMIVPDVGEWVEVYFIAGNKDHPVYMGIANEMKDQLTASYTENTKNVVFETGNLSIIFDETTNQLVLTNGSEKIILDANLGITLSTGDASIWRPSIMSVCPYTGAPHGGAGALIIKLKGA
jgi:hypothetical protein